MHVGLHDYVGRRNARQPFTHKKLEEYAFVHTLVGTPDYVGYGSARQPYTHAKQ